MAELDQLRFRSSFGNLSTQRQARLLAALAHELTIAARNAYPDDSSKESSVKELIAFNELQHRLSDQIRKLIEGNEDRYPPEIVVDMIFDWAMSEGREEWLLRTVDRIA